MTLPTGYVGLPPCSGRLDGWTGWATFAAGTLSTIRDDPRGVDEQRGVETAHPDRHNADVVCWHKPIQNYDDGSMWCGKCDTEVGAREVERQAFLRRVQHVDPRERRA